MTHYLGEMRQIGSESRDALHEVIPSFIRRANEDHRHYKAYSEFLGDLHTNPTYPKFKRTEGFLDMLPGASMVDRDGDAESKVIAAILYEGSDLSMGELLFNVIKYMNRSEMKMLVEMMAATRKDRRHKLNRGLEHASFTFDIVADYGVYRDLHRHRILTQQRQTLGCDLGFVVSPEMESWKEIKFTYENAMIEAAVSWGLLKDKVGPVLAQYAVPLAYNIRWLMKANLREWIWICELRTIPQGHPNYRKIAQQIYRGIITRHPIFKPFFKFVDLNDYSLGRAGAEEKQEKRLRRN